MSAVHSLSWSKLYVGNVCFRQLREAGQVADLGGGSSLAMPLRESKGAIPPCPLRIITRPINWPVNAYSTSLIFLYVIFSFWGPQTSYSPTGALPLDPAEDFHLSDGFLPPSRFPTVFTVSSSSSGGIYPCKSVAVSMISCHVVWSCAHCHAEWNGGRC